LGPRKIIPSREFKTFGDKTRPKAWSLLEPMIPICFGGVFGMLNFPPTSSHIKFPHQQPVVGKEKTRGLFPPYWKSGAKPRKRAQKFSFLRVILKKTFLFTKKYPCL